MAPLVVWSGQVSAKVLPAQPHKEVVGGGTLRGRLRRGQPGCCVLPLPISSAEGRRRRGGNDLKKSLPSGSEVRRR